MVVRTRAIREDTGAIDEACLLTYYGCTPADWEEASSDHRFVEYIDGRLIVHSPVSLRHARLFGFLHELLQRFVRGQQPGEVLAGPFAMELSIDRKFEPDLIFVSAARQANLTPDRLLGPADLAIEIASPSTRSYDRGEKRECYRVGGVREYWMIDGIQRLMTLDRPAGVEVAATSAGIVRSATCPGFWLRAEWCWQEPPPSVDDCLAEILSGDGQSGS
jgi:Uma2 family endonuclease